MSKLGQMWITNNIFEDVLAGMSHHEIAIKYDMTIEAVRKTINDVFAQTSERYADLRQRISMLSVLRYEHLLGMVMPYAKGGIMTTKNTDGSITEEPLPVDPRFVRLAVDIIKAENDIFEKERKILLETQDDEGNAQYTEMTETILTGDDLYKSAAMMMGQMGVAGAMFADLDSEDVLAHSIATESDEMMPIDFVQKRLLEKANKLVPEDDAELMAEARRRGLIDEDGNIIQIPDEELDYEEIEVDSDWSEWEDDDA